MLYVGGGPCCDEAADRVWNMAAVLFQQTPYNDLTKAEKVFLHVHVRACVCVEGWTAVSF